MKAILFTSALLLGLISWGQNFEVYLEPVSVPQFAGVQSFAFGHDSGKILVVGGRLDGLHRRQPWASFDAAGHNNQLFVIDPATQTVWSSSLSSLAVNVQAQLSSTNLEFYQDGDMLYLVGGYGMNSSGNHITFPNLTAIDVPGITQAIINNQNIAPFVRQITHSDLKVTGGQLWKVDTTYYLVGGQLFDGRYNPMGPSHGPGFTQAYTDAVRRFHIQDDGVNLSVQFLNEYQDANLLHKRDFNAVPVIHADGTDGIYALSGVFQHTVDLPWINAVHIDANGFSEVAGFSHYYNPYHAAKLFMYHPATKSMEYILFGGIAQYYLQNGQRVQDNNVPFVKTITRITADSMGVMTETPLNMEMPDYLGAGAEFIPTHPYILRNEIMDGSTITNDSVEVGFIVGGIHSSAPNIFFMNDGTQSDAYTGLFRVYLIKPSFSMIERDFEDRAMYFAPNPSTGQGLLYFNHVINEESNIQLISAEGRIVREFDCETYTSPIAVNMNNLPDGAYILKLITTEGEWSTKVNLQRRE